MPLSWNEIKERAVQFSQNWSDSSREKSDSQTFWNEFFAVFGVQRRTVASFEEPVKNIKGQYGYIDLFWRGKLLAEHKSAGKDLTKAASQAFEYIQCMKNEGRDDEIPQYVVVSDFRTIILYNLEPDEDDLPVQEISVKELHKYVHTFAFIPGYKVHKLKKEDPANIEAAERMGKIHDVLFANGYSGHDLERFLVRLLFCLFAEDTGIFEPNAFTTFVENSTRDDGDDLGIRIGHFFQILNTPKDKRQKTLDELLANLPYVDGGLFEEKLTSPDCNRDIRNSILGATKFDWSKISPAIFGSLFQSIMNPKERRKIGAHYTTEENILKVINPLFMDDLRKEFQKCKTNKAKLTDFHRKLHSLIFFDPACGCGNFLVLAYRELRMLEMDVLTQLFRKDAFDPGLFFQVDVDQFYGIEIVEFPVRIAETALWLMDHQMNIIASEKFGRYFIRLPLQKSAKIIHGNALRIEWNDVVANKKCSYILSNPPYIGKTYQSSKQKEDVKQTLGNIKSFASLDYVCCWFIKAADYIQNTNIPVGLVSTSSVGQGEQVGILWQELLSKQINIHFAYPTFKWTSEARGRANVHCVIIGFCNTIRNDKILYEELENGLHPRLVKNISPYLVEGANVMIHRRSTPICDVPKMIYGNKPVDGGHLIFTEEEKHQFLQTEPKAAPYFRPLISGREFINRENRWCLWLKAVSPKDLQHLPFIRERVERVKQTRLASIDPQARNLADYPYTFRDTQNPKTCIVVPRVSSDTREYVPMDFMDSRCIISDSCQMLPDATIYHFGVLTSLMHMSWMRRVCGRLEIDYRYSIDIVYNNFPWPDVTEKQRQAIEEKSQAVLDARKLYSDCSFAQLYNPILIPKELRKAHRELDKVVEKAYRKEPFLSERERVEFLFGLYEKLTKQYPSC